ncbi:MAG: segregation/condensation protein A [Planctomycetota bacterium]
MSYSIENYRVENYRVELDVFAGPLDLLLYLIRKEEVEIHEVEIGRICDQYMEYLRMLQSLDIDLSADFLVMAASLMVIKARKMLPGEQVNLEEELDPEDDLIRQLLEYKKYKTLARELQGRAVLRHRMFGASRREKADEVPLEEIGLFDLFGAFTRLVQETGLGRLRLRMEGERPLREYLLELAEKLRHTPRLLFRDLFQGHQTRGDLIGMFIALLELIKQRVVRAKQPEPLGDIEIELIGDPDVALTLTAAELAWADSAPVDSAPVADLSPGDESRSPQSPGGLLDCEPPQGEPRTLAGTAAGENAEPHGSSEAPPLEEGAES